MTCAEDPDLVRAAVAGNADALRLLLESAFETLVHRLERRIPRDLRSVCSAEDVAQDALVEVCRGIGAFRPAGDGAFRRWIYAIALSRLRNAIRRQRAQKRGGGHAADVMSGPRANPDPASKAKCDALPEPLPDAGGGLTDGELLAELSAATRSLPIRYREVVQLLHIDEFSVVEVAARMGKSQRAVLGLGRRAREMLRVRLSRSAQ